MTVLFCRGMYFDSDKVRVEEVRELLSFIVIVNVCGLAPKHLPPPPQPSIAYLAVLIVRLLTYVDLGMHDSSSSSLDFPCISKRKFEDRYCSKCKKMVPGLDHHCSWLNTCVGKSNYGRFLLVVTLGVVLHLVHVGYGTYFSFVVDGGGEGGAQAHACIAATFCQVTRRH